MRTINYQTYFDKVYGCFLGKCVGGTAGGPAEGRKELMDAPLNEELLHVALPNDDLDLQILWLELLEDRGPRITARDMAKEFYDKVPYGPGEYGFFKKNFGRGIYPPLSGVYNNRYYQNGMGCPIRSEIWACLFPGNAELAKPYIQMDGSLDHKHDSIEAEYFLASMEAEAFFCDDFETIFAKSLARLEKDSKLYRVLDEVHRLYHEGREWKYTRAMILRHYGHSDCTNMYQNLGLILLALLYGGMDFRETVRIGLACGYDTDCICASAASILGAMQGAKVLLERDGLSDTGLNIEVHTRRRTGSIQALAQDVCRAGLSMMKACSADVTIMDADVTPSLPESPTPAAFSVEAVYSGDPVLRPDREAVVTLKLTSSLSHDAAVKISILPPKDVTAVLSASEITIPAGEEKTVTMTAALMENAEVLHEKNIFTITLDDGEHRINDTFGLVGCAVWYRYGPFLMNNKDLSETVPPHVPYGAHIKLEPGENGYDVTRDFHLNNFADPDRAFVDETQPFTAIPSDGRAECVPEEVVITEDLFDTAELDSFDGPHTDYLVRYLDSPEERTLELAVGHTAPFKLWINGTLIAEDKTTTWWTCENRHLTVTFHKGENIIILKCSQQSDTAKYSLIPRINGGRWRQWEDFGSILKGERTLSVPVTEQMTRIREMEEKRVHAEKVLSALRNAVKDYRNIQPVIGELLDYAQSETFMKDLDADAAGKLPENLLRGVLSEDGISDIAEENAALAEVLENS